MTRRAILLLLCSLLGVPFVARTDDTDGAVGRVSPYGAKTAFVLKFPEFISWPEGSLGANGSIKLGVAASDRDFKHFFALHERKVSVNGENKPRRLVVHRYDPKNGPAKLDIVYVTHSYRRQLPDVVKQMSNRATLIISESEDSLDKGSMIDFFINEQSRMRFEIRDENARKRGLKIDAQLLQVSEERP